ncbi:iron complex transport system ATP-binding protein [Chitinophaga niastensis]|uniref:Iron complex transport system ATP-binding protein n=1 Tax=Chitinophaga niastensis TaxID=536980 RepID=A0A2P8HJF2_CHINA|nr:heme ABC transporter ATP-binding protein [Chitinophaga niastensis]PSL46341.1 iron complex transport system ATP-binding protein [Chitinophaga niastensis]
MIQLSNITCKAGNKILLQNINARFEPGKLHLVIGPNGAGKSTLLKIAGGQISPHAGTVLYETKRLETMSYQALARVRAALSQHMELSFPLKVWEVVMMGRYPHIHGNHVRKDIRYCHEAMQLFDLEELSERDYMSLSGGEKQRVHFARIMAQIWEPVPGSCRYLLLDEPLTFLDVHYQFQFMQLLKTLLQQQDLVIIGVVHDLNIAAKFADNILLLHHGKLVCSGTREAVLTSAHIREVYRLEPVIYETSDRYFLFF